MEPFSFILFMGSCAIYPDETNACGSFIKGYPTEAACERVSEQIKKSTTDALRKRGGAFIFRFADCMPVSAPTLAPAGIAP